MLPRIIPFTRCLTNNSSIWSAIEAKMNRAPLEDIFKSITEFKQTNSQPFPPIYYDLLIDLCKTDEEFESVLSEMIDSKNFFTISRLQKLDIDKIEKILKLTIDKNSCSFLTAMKILLGHTYHNVLDSIYDFNDGKLEFKELIKTHIKLPLLPVLELLVKLKHLYTFASEVRNHLVHDDIDLDFALAPQRRLIGMFLLHQLICTYNDNTQVKQYQDKIWLALDLIKESNKINSEKFQNRPNHHNRGLISNSEVLADLYEVCLRRNNMKLAVHAFNITHTHRLVGHYSDQVRYFVNLIHLHSVLKIRSESTKIDETQKSESINSFLNHNIVKAANSNSFLPTADLFLAHMHYQIANTLDPFDKQLFLKFPQLSDTRRSSEVSENITNWTRYYTKTDIIPIATYCNMLYIIENFASKLKTPLTEEQVNDLLKHLIPGEIRLERHRSQYLKALAYFNNFITKSYNDKHPPIEVNNLIMLAYSRVNAFPPMRTLYLKMCLDENSVNMQTYSLLITAAINQGLEADCRFIFAELWSDIQQLHQPVEIPNSVVEGVIECLCICKEQKRALFTINRSFKEKRVLDLGTFAKFLSSCCKATDITAVTELTDTLSALQDDRYNDILHKCYLKIETLKEN